MNFKKIATAFTPARDSSFKDKLAKTNEHTKELYKASDIRAINTASNICEKTQNKDKFYQKKQSGALKIYLKSVAFTAGLCVLAFLIMMMYLTCFQTDKASKAKGELAVPLEHTTVSKTIRWMVFLRSPYSNNLSEVIFFRVNPSATAEVSGRIIISALPPSFVLKSGTIGEYFAKDGPLVCVEKINEYLGTSAMRFFDFSSENLYALTKTYGNITYKLDEEISYYNPKTAASFLASAGYNKLNGTDCVKMIEYYRNGSFVPDPAKADAVASDLVKCFFSLNLKLPEFSRERFIALLNSCKCNVTAFDYEDIKSTGAAFMAGDFKPEVIKTEGVYSSSDSFSPSDNFLNALAQMLQ